MASSLRLITSNLVKRSLLPTLVSSSRFHSIIAGHRSYSTMPKDDLCDYSWVNVKCPKISSLSFKMEMSDRKRKISLAIPDEGLSVELDDFPALNIQETKACSEQTLFVQGKPHKDISLNVLNKTSSSDDTTPNKDGVILNIIANEIIASFRDMTTKRGWAYYEGFVDLLVYIRLYILLQTVADRLTVLKACKSSSCNSQN
ncbi:hypothetical protein QVD17_31166 [Tagetes erecta]|uniref:Uncharacterized protein n=1 Tax=Tagetes erecta TaxID=13708 RepID=A0AAD8K2W1_TARER|nr:hypothetical protein QVD17_31166 [Tagetes erecta]